MPLYITSTGEGEAKVERLVEANNKAVARNFVARGLVGVELASQADLFRLAKAGKEVEVATDKPEVGEDGGASGGGIEPVAEPKPTDDETLGESREEEPPSKRGK